MANIYGKVVYMTSSLTGSVVLTNPNHGTLSVSKTSGFVGEIITIYSSMQPNYYISKYLLNGSAINGNTFKLVEGENVITCVEYYQASEEASTYTLTVKYYKDGVIDNLLTKTYSKTNSSYINPSGYAKSINGYKYSYCVPTNSFTINSNSTISLYYEKEVEINPFDYVSVISLYSTRSFRLELALKDTAPFESLDISGNGFAQYKTEQGILSFNGAVSLATYGRTNSVSLTGNATYYEIELETTYNSKTYKKTFTYGTKTASLISPIITENSVEKNDSEDNIYYAWNVENTNNQAVVFYYKIGNASSYTTKTISANSTSVVSEYAQTNKTTLTGYFVDNSDNLFDSEQVSLSLTYTPPVVETYYELKVVSYKPNGSVNKTEYYSIKEGYYVNPTDYLPTTPSGWKLKNYSPTSSFFIHDNTTLNVYFEDEESNTLTWSDLNVRAIVGYNSSEGHSELKIAATIMDEEFENKTITISSASCESDDYGQKQLSGSGVGSVQTEYAPVGGNYSWSCEITVDGLGSKTYSGSGSTN